MARKKLSFDEIMKLADAYGVRDNVLFASAADRYSKQMEIIEKIHQAVQETGLMVEHTNVKGDINVDVNPLIVQLPKHNDTANKTLAVMLDLIMKLGSAVPAGDKLSEFLSE